MRHQYPPSQALMKLGASVSNRRMSCLDRERLREIEQHLLQRRTFVHSFPKLANSELLSSSLDLNIHRMRRPVGTKHDGGATHSLAADDTYLNGRAVGLNGHDRCDSSLHEKHVF